MFERVLVCTDGAAGAAGALRLANALAERDGCTVDVLSVIAPVFLEGVTLYALPGEAGVPDGPWVDDYEDRVREQLRQIGGAVGDADLRVEIGHVAHTIATFAESRGARLILLGLGRHGLAERWGGGETALQVSRLARVPVLAVPEDAGAIPRKAVVGVDFSDYSRDAALIAASLLGPRGRLHLVHATWVSPAGRAVDGEWRTTYHSGARTRLHEQVRELVAHGAAAEVQVSVATGEPAEAVLKAARESGAELIAAGSHGYGFFTRMLLGSTSTRLLRGASCAVLVAPPRASSPELRHARDAHARRADEHAELPVPALAG